MPTYNSVINRTGSQALMPEDVAREIIQGVAEQSAVMKLGTKLPDMTTKQRRLPVLSSLPTAFFVDGDTGLKQTSNVAWDNKFIEAEELAVIIPIPEAVLDDADYDIFEQVKPRVIEAMGRAFDAAVLYGTNKPASWVDGIVTQATASGNVVTAGTGTDLYDDIMGEDGVISVVEQDGFMVNGHIAAMEMRGKLRGLRDSTGQPIFISDMKAATPYALDGEPVEFPKNGAVDPTNSLLVSGDFTNLVYAMRQDITFKVLDQAVITDASGAIIYNLAQQDMVALRCVMRLGWQVPNPISAFNSNNATRYPFAVYKPAVV